MKKASIPISYDAEKLLALEQYMAKKDTRLTDELEAHTHRLYEIFFSSLPRYSFYY